MCLFPLRRETHTALILLLLLLLLPPPLSSTPAGNARLWATAASLHTQTQAAAAAAAALMFRVPSSPNASVARAYSSSLARATKADGAHRASTQNEQQQQQPLTPPKEALVVHRYARLLELSS